MTPEQLDKAIQFLIEQQAAFDAAVHAAIAAFDRDREAAKQDREQTEARFRDVAKKQEQTLALVQANSEQIQALKDACRDLLEHANYTDFRLNRLENPKNR